MPNRTLAIIKPDAVAKGAAGKIIALLEKEGFVIKNMQMMTLSHEKAEGFYAVHKGKPFFDGLMAFMTSGPCIPMELQKEDAIPAWRKLMGATDPAQAEEGTIRKLFAEDKQKNSVHGSDSTENAAIEIKYFFG